MENIHVRKNEEIVDFLYNVSIFSKLEKEELCKIKDKCKKLNYKKGEIICKKDDYARSFFVIKSGEVTEFAMDDNEFSVMIKYSSKNDYFGDLGVLVDDSYATTVISYTNTVIISIPSEVFSQLVWSNPCIMKEILRNYKNKLQNSAKKVMSCTMFNSEGRLAHILLSLHNDSSRGKFVNETQETLSNRCGISRQTVSAILNKWKKIEVVKIYRGKIEIIDINELTNIILDGAKV